ncbi:adenylyltransferase/cytidyltransferase family protein [Microbacteriaceae bacterium 4G12]
MKIVHLSECSTVTPVKCVVALGCFDGVHLGHQEVIKAAKEIAHKQNMKCAVMTFSPHPKEVISRGKHKVNYLMPLADKADKIKGLGVDLLYVVDFNLQTAALPPKEFVEQYLVKLHVKHVVAGFDFTYGAKGKGNMSTLKNHARGRFYVTTILPITEQREKISSTRIRNTLKSGKVEEIPSLLGDVYQVKGEMLEMSDMFPNELSVVIYDQYTLPEAGVYEITVSVQGNTYKGSCEVHSFMQRVVSISVRDVWMFPEDTMVTICFLQQQYAKSCSVSS